MIRALIFDFDGLLMDTEVPEVETWRELFAEHGVDFPLDTWVRDVVGSTASNFNPATYITSVTGHSVDQAVLQARARTLRLDKLSRLGPLPGVIRVLDDARRLGLKKAVASSSPHAWVDGYLRQLELTSSFDAVICREDAPRLKPDPDLFLAALTALGASAGEALVFEDSPNGILAANRAGIRVVAVPNAITKHGNLSGATLILASLADLPLEELLEKFKH
jgi:HAD superfamily hydrolase (TIGR01509 family)